MYVSLIIPAFNEEKRLVPFLDSVTRYVARHGGMLREIIVVDDGSTDATATVAVNRGKRLKNLRVVRHAQNRGKGAAVQTGVLTARGDLIVFIDADGATPIDELPKMVAALATADIAVGNRWMPGARTARHSTLRKISGFVYRLYMRLFGLGAIDTMCGFKGYHRHVARDLFATIIDERWLFDTEIAYRARLRKYSTNNFPIHWESKDGSKLSAWGLIKSAFQILPLVRRVGIQEKRLRAAKSTVVKL